MQARRPSGSGPRHAVIDAVGGPGQTAAATRPTSAALDWSSALDLVGVVADAPNGAAAAAGIADRLRIACAADRVVLMRSRGSEPLAIAPAGAGGRDGVTALVSLRDEAALTGRTVRVLAKGAPTDDALRHHHAQHASAARLEGVVTFPLRRAGVTFAYAILERRIGAFSAAETEWLDACAALAGPWLGLALQADRSAFARLRDRIADGSPRERRAAHSLAAAGAVLATALVVGAAFWPVQARVSAVARVEGTQQRELVASVDGYLKAVYARPGDAVRAGTPLADLDDRELTLDAERFSSEAAQATAAANEALAKRDRATGVFHQAKADEARAQLDLVMLQLGQVVVRAPFDGVVIAGDLRNRVGSPVKRGDTLFSVAPAGKYRIAAEVPERDIGSVQAGQSAQLLLAAEPGRPLALSVRRVSPVGHETDGAVTFEIEAEPAATDLVLRPGLSGIAHVDIGKRPLWRVLAGRLVDAVRYAWWGLGG